MVFWEYCVRTRSPHVFRNERVNADVLLVSACLSLMRQAIEYDGDAYWTSLWPVSHRR